MKTKFCLLVALLLTGGLLSPSHAMLGGTDHSTPPDHIADAWNLPPDARQSWSKAYGVDVSEKSSSIPMDVLHPGDKATFVLHVTNDTDQPVTTGGRLDVIRYALKTKENDFFSYSLESLGTSSSTPVLVNLPAHGSEDVTVSPDIPALFGGYALILDLGKSGRHLATLCIRTFPPEAQPGQFPVFTLDELDPAMLDLLGIHSIRIGVDYRSTTDPGFAAWLADYGRKMAEYQKHHITVMEIAQGGNGPYALGQWGHMLDDHDVMNGGFNDTMFLPSADPDFSKFVQAVCGTYGWPKGPITAICLYNEPWEGGGISGWLADMPRYREAYAAMAQGVVNARKQDGTQVLIGGTDSTSNALDKLFGDGKDTFLPTFDFVSMHYQGLASSADIPLWRDRKGPYGRVRRWDTESWVANTDDRIAPLLASWRAAGYDRLMGVDSSSVIENGHPGAPGAALAAATHFLGDRPFHEFLFKNGLPWVMVFDGLPNSAERNNPEAASEANPEDGTVVVTGDILAGTTSLYRTVESTAQRDIRAGLRAKLAALPAEATSKDRQALETAIDNVPRSGGTLTLPADRRYSLYDFYGNPQPSPNGKIVVPLNANGFFLRGDGKPGSFAALLAALKIARVDGLDPVEIVAHDMTAPLAEKPSLRLTLTNVLNRPVTGTVTAALGALTLASPQQTVTLGPNQTKEVSLRIFGGAETPGNTYPLTVTVDAGADGKVTHSEDMHCNVIARKTITVDGNLDDWQGVLPQPVAAGGNAPSLTEQAWYPGRNFDVTVKQGFATGYLAYDARYFYFAAKVADDTPTDGTLRFAVRDDDQFFFSEKVYLPASEGINFSVRWTGQIQPRYTETYIFTAQTDDGVRLWVNGKQIVDAWNDKGPSPETGSIALEAGRKYDLKLEYYQGTGSASAQLLWQSKSQPQQVIPTSRLFPSAAGAVGTGLTGQYYSGRNFEDLKVTRLDPAVNFTDWGENKPVDPKLDDSSRTTLTWPKGVRRYTYRKSPTLPAGNGLTWLDNIQIAFNVIPEDDIKDKGMYPFPPGTMPHYTPYKDTDYEYALNQVAPQYDGGTEIWRMQVPGMPRKHFYPRQPKSPYDGPAVGGKLVVKWSGGMRIVEAAIPWSEIPWVKKRLDAGQTVKFSFRVNDDDGTGYELAHDRSVSATNGSSFHVDWERHWSNEVEFGFGK